MEIFQQTIIPSLITGLICLYLGFRLHIGRDRSDKRREHRRKLRSLRDLHVSRHRASDTVESLRHWWVTAIEDYGPIDRRRISRKIDLLGGVTFPRPEWDEHCETSYDAASQESKDRYNKESNDRRTEFMGILDNLISIA